jgi:anti-anti-sigma regulatory factor
MQERDVPVTLKQSETLNEISLGGVVDIGCAAELKMLLLQVLNPGKTVRISFEETRDLDVTAVQLLWAAERQSRNLGVELTFAGIMPEQVSNALAQAGFDGLPFPVGAKHNSEVKKCQP